MNFLGINSHAKTFNNLNSLDNLDKDKEILCMSWTDPDEQDEVRKTLFQFENPNLLKIKCISNKICFATKDNHLVRYKTDHLAEAPFEDLGKLDVGNGLIKALDFIDRNKFVTCVDSGELKVWSIDDQNLVNIDVSKQNILV